MITILILLFILFFILIFYKSYDKCEHMENEYILPKNIFTFWHDKDLDPFVEANINNWKKKLPDWTIHVITLENIGQYIPIEYYSQFEDNIYQHFADHIRLYLLEHYGGVWMDAGIIIIDPNWLNNAYNSCKQNKNDALLFEYKSHSTSTHPYLENWFIIAPRGSILIKDWKHNFNNCYFDGKDKCRNDLLKCGIDIEHTIKHNNYLMMHAVMNCMYLKKKYNIDIRDASESMFYIQDLKSNDQQEMIKYLFSNKFNENKNIYMIKFIGKTRREIYKYIDEYVRFVSRI